MRWAEPGWLLLLALAPMPWWLGRARRSAHVGWSCLEMFGPVGRRSAWRKILILNLLRGGAIACVAVALARPQSVAGRTPVSTRGAAIMLVLDHSSSMSAGRFSEDSGDPSLSRLNAAKQMLRRFIEERPDDLLGLVVFANYPDLSCPLTLDHRFLLDVLRDVRPVRPGDDGTNLGDALVWATEAIHDAPSRSKAIILLTDGRNSPAVPDPADPLEASRLARELGVMVHAIAIGQGTPGDEGDPGPDLDLLRELAQSGGGRWFEASSPSALDQVYAALDLLVKSPARGEVRVRYHEEYPPWAALGLVLLGVDRWLSAGRWRGLP